jgi:hypothetical protein
VVIYRDDANRVGMMEPYTSLPPYGSPDERELWKWLQSYEDKTGGRVLATARRILSCHRTMSLPTMKSGTRVIST